MFVIETVKAIREMLKFQVCIEYFIKNTQNYIFKIRYIFRLMKILIILFNAER